MLVMFSVSAINCLTFQKKKYILKYFTNVFRDIANLSPDKSLGGTWFYTKQFDTLISYPVHLPLIEIILHVLTSCKICNLRF